MSLQLILGNAGAGKTHYLYEHVIKEAMENPERNYLVIVPEQFTMATQKELVLRHPKGGILNIDVLSFGRLAHRIFEEVGRTYDIVLDDEGKNLILRKIAGDYENELKVIGRNLKKFGYISEVKSVISEFTQYNIGEEKLVEIKASVPQDSMLAYKLDDIAIIYRGFYEYLGEKYITGEELLGKLSGSVAESHILRDSVITFDGFTGFTPVQENLIQALLKVCNMVYMTVTTDEEEFYSGFTGQELFGLSKETVKSMSKLAKNNQIEIKKPIILGEKPIYRFRNNEAMGFLEESLFRYKNKKFTEKQEEIQVHLLRNPEEESRWVASEIKRLVRTKGYRYQEIAVIASSMEAYGVHLKRACEQYHIPIFTDQKRSILLNSFIEYVRSALAMIEKNYTYETVFRFLKSGFAPMSMERVDELETYVLSRGIKGYKKWQEPWLKDSERMSEQQWNYLNQSRVKFVERIQGLHGILTQRGKTVADICVALYEFFLASNVQQMIEMLELELQEDGHMALAKEYNQIYGVVLELFDKFVGLLGDEQVSLREFNELFDAGLEEARVGVIPPSIDTVIIGDITRTRVGNVKVLFFVGGNDSHLPGNMNASGLLSERDREWFHTNEIRLKPSSKAQIYIQKFYLYLMLTKPSDYLKVSMSKTSMEGKSVRPAYLINELRKLFPNMDIIEEEMGLSHVELTKEVGLHYLIEGLKNRVLQEHLEWKELYRWYRTKPEWKEALRFIQSANQYRKSEDRLTAEVAKELYGTVLKNSVTRLEKFAGCPYAHFLTYGLGLKERELYEFEAVDLGNVFHHAMEVYSDKVKEHHMDWKTIDLDIQKKWAEEAVEESVKDYEYAILFKSERDKYNIERIKRMMKRSVWAVSKQLACGKFEPEGFEVAFGEEALESTNITLAQGQKMMLRGKIDRVDLCQDGDKTYVKILDYKTGSKELSLSELYHGLQLQLFVYLNAATELEAQKAGGKRVIPAGVLYYRMNDPIIEVGGGKSTYNSVDGMLDVERNILQELTPDGLVNSAANVIEMLDEALEETSYAIPVSKDAKGELKKTSKAISEEQFTQIAAFTNWKVREIGEQIVEGEIGISPYKEDKKTGCDYCEFQKICGFDGRIPGYEYRKLEQYKQEKSLERMNEILGEQEEQEEGEA